MSRLGWDTREITELQAKEEDCSWWDFENAFFRDYFQKRRLSPEESLQYKHEFLSSTIARVEGPGENC